jgi:hypothetical protein
MESKVCIRCNLEKSIEEFYKHKKMADGHLNVCKECKKSYQSFKHNENKNNEHWCENERIRHRDKYYRLNYKEKHKPTTEKKRETMKRYLDKYPEKQLAKNATHHMDKQVGHHLHHWSYNEEHFKDVIELEYKIHAKVHRYLKYDKYSKMYRTLDGELLDSKDKHQSYISKVISL